MTKRKFYQLLKKTPREWRINDNKKIRSGALRGKVDFYCPLHAVADLLDVEHGAYITRGIACGLSRGDASIIAYASDLATPKDIAIRKSRRSLLRAVGLGG